MVLFQRNVYYHEVGLFLTVNTLIYEQPDDEN